MNEHHCTIIINGDMLMSQKLPSTYVLYGLFLIVILAAMAPAFQNISNLFVSTGFEPHGHCFLWETGILRLYVISDLLTGTSYVAISLMLVYLVYMVGRDLPFNRIFLMFGAFIITCGMTHFMDVWTLWNPTYWLSGFVRLLTAIASTATAVALPTVLPRTLKLARDARVSRERGIQLTRTNAELQREINERMKAVEALKEKEARLRQIIDNAPVIVWSTDQKGNLLTFEGKGRERLNISANETAAASGETAVDVADPETIFDVFPQAAALRTSLERALEGHESVTIAETSDYVFEIRNAPIELDNTITGITGIATDITERRQAEIKLQHSLERERELSELKSRFITTISHEFRTPMTIISSSAYLLERYHERMEFDKQRAKLRNITQEITRMTAMLTDFLTIEHMEKGEIKLIPEPVQPEVLLQSAIERAEDIRNDNHTIKWDQEKSCPDVMVDKELFSQVIDILLNNAIKYSPDGGTISIRLNCENDYAIIQISDRGIGIPSDEIPRIFDLFYRASNVTYIPGTGLGLNIARRIIEQHGGQINVESTLNVGSSFTLRLPL